MNEGATNYGTYSLLQKDEVMKGRRSRETKSKEQNITAKKLHEFSLFLSENLLFSQRRRKLLEKYKLDEMIPKITHYNFSFFLTSWMIYCQHHQMMCFFFFFLQKGSENEANQFWFDCVIHIKLQREYKSNKFEIKKKKKL